MGEATEKGCLNWDCSSRYGWSIALCPTIKHCSKCGEELQPYPNCRCGRPINLKEVKAVEAEQRSLHCMGCGQRLDNSTLGPILSQNMREMVRGLAQEKAQN